jgi:hypothetical protein
VLWNATTTGRETLHYRICIQSRQTNGALLATGAVGVELAYLRILEEAECCSKLDFRQNLSSSGYRHRTNRRKLASIHFDDSTYNAVRIHDILAGDESLIRNKFLYGMTSLRKQADLIMTHVAIGWIIERFHNIIAISKMVPYKANGNPSLSTIIHPITGSKRSVAFSIRRTK